MLKVNLHRITRLASAGSLASLQSWVQSKWPDVTFFVSEWDDPPTFKLHSLIVPKEQRKQGIGAQIMQALVRLADQQGKRIVLSPGEKDSHHGTTSKGRLVRFYKQFGFKENKGRNKDYQVSESMIREPSRSDSHE